MPMHCSANYDDDGDVAPLFRASPAPAKRPSPADPSRTLVGDDEHGWADHGVFNFERRLLRQGDSPEPRERARDFCHYRAFWDDSRERRAGQGLSLGRFRGRRAAPKTPARPIPSTLSPTRVRGRVAGHPKDVVFLSADAFGVLPPISKLTPEGAMYYFLSGYTAKLAGTERGVTEPKATFSACFGAPFMPRPPSVYANLFGGEAAAARLERLAHQHGLDGWPLWNGHAHPAPAHPRNGPRRALRQAQKRAHPALIRFSA